MRRLIAVIVLLLAAPATSSAADRLCDTASPSSNSQEEHNYFTLKPEFFTFFSDQFERQWTNSTGHLEIMPSSRCLPTVRRTWPRSTELYFAATGAQTIRIQRCEDGISLDHIVLSPSSFITAPPGAARSDTTLSPEDTGDEARPSDAGELVLYASDAFVAGNGFTTIADPSAAGAANPESADGLAIDQVVLSPAAYRERPPGALKDDTTIPGKRDGS